MANPKDRSEAIFLMSRAVGAAQMYSGYDEAERLLGQALQFDPDNGEIYHNRGMVYYRIQRWQEALSDFSRAIALAPHPLSYEQRAAVHYRMGNRLAARQDLEQALRMDRRRFQAIANLGWFAFEEACYQDAIGYFSAAIEVEPTAAGVYANRARAYIALGRSPEAMADLMKAQELVDSGRDTSNNDRSEW